MIVRNKVGSIPDSFLEYLKLHDLIFLRVWWETKIHIYILIGWSRNDSCEDWYNFDEWIWKQDKLISKKM